MTKTLRRAALAAAALTALTTVAAPSALAHGPEGLRAVGLAGAGTELVVFRTDAPGDARSLGPLAGLDGDTALIGIDYRPHTARLYGVGDSGGVYLIDDRTGDAERVGELSTALSGSYFGVDVDPVADALRIVSDTGQNLSQPFGDGDAPAGPTDAQGALHRDGIFTLAPAGGITAAAYINNDDDPDTGTSLVDLDTRDDRLAGQHPVDEGTLRGLGGTGTLTDLEGDTGLDVHSSSNWEDERDDDGFAAVAMGGEYRLLAVDLRDSTFVDRGAFPTDVLDLAVDPAQ